MSQNRFNEFIAHFSKEISQELEAFVIDQALLHSRYFFVRRVTSTIQRGYCTHCQSDYVIKSSSQLTHNQDWQCQKCNSLVMVKQAGRGRGKMHDKVYVLFYEKSKICPSTITATGYNVDRDYRDDMKGRTTIKPVARYLFGIGNTAMMYRNHSYSGMFNTRVMRFEEGWSFAKKPWSMIGKNSYTRHSEQSIASIHKAVEGTPFSYANWGGFAEKNMDLIRFFSKFSKYPFIEYLEKMGMKEIVESMVEERDLHNSINHRGKTVVKILGLSKKEIKDWKQSNVQMKPITLMTYKWFRDNGVTISWEAADGCDHLLVGSYYREKLDFIQTLLPLEKIVRYIQNQIKKDPKHHRSITSVLLMWKDYLNECQELKMDITLSQVLLPNNLHKAHRETMRKIKMKEDEVLNQRIANLFPKLEKYCFEKDGLMIRPAASSLELFDEGEKLSHCVGGYAERYSKGETVILFVRKTTESEKPFYTVEVTDNDIVQAYGYDNTLPTREVERFLKHFRDARLTKKSKKRKVAI
jgi:transposase-like protein